MISSNDQTTFDKTGEVGKGVFVDFTRKTLRLD